MTGWTCKCGAVNDRKMSDYSMARCNSCGAMRTLVVFTAMGIGVVLTAVILVGLLVPAAAPPAAESPAQTQADATAAMVEDLKAETHRQAISQHLKQAIMYSKLETPEWENALHELNSAAALDETKTHFDIYMNRGAINMQRPTPQYVKAEEDLRHAITLPVATEVQLAFCHFNLAVLYARTSRNDESLEHLRKAVQLGFDKRDDIEQEIGKFDALRNDPRYTQALTDLQPPA